MSSETLVLKVGGGRTIDLGAIARDLAAVGPAVVVHGANAARDDLATRLGTPPRRVTSASGVESVLTDDEQLELLTMAYAGIVNKRFVQRCQQEGVNAVGLTGLDGGLVKGRRNAGIRVVDNGKKRILRDHSGKPVDINVGLLRLLLSDGYTPLVTVPILDENGRAINTENDTVVSLLQERLRAARVVQLLEAPGFLARKDDPESVVRRMSFDELEEWSARASGRFRRKLMALSAMQRTGCEAVFVADGRVEHPVTRALSGEGTTIR